MTRVLPFTAAFFLSLALSGCATRKHMSPGPNERAAYQWLCAQQGPHGILGNQDGESFSGLYPNAMAAMLFLENHDRERCERVLDFFESKRESDLQEAPGGLHQFYDSATGATLTDSDRWMGDNCWLLIALNHYHARTGSERYRALANSIADWLVGLQDADGGIWAGYNKSGPMRAKSTEGNLDAYAALTSRPNARKRVRDWLWNKAWLGKEKRFRMGSTNADPALDTSAWGVLALGRKARPSLTFAENTFLRKKKSDANGKLIEGFADFVSKDRIWLEGTGEMACAYQMSGQRHKAEWLIGELEKAMVPGRSAAGSLTIPCFTNDPSWDTGSTKGFVPSVCWYLFARWQFNPMQGFKP